MPCLKQLLLAAPGTTSVLRHPSQCGLNVYRASILLPFQTKSHANLSVCFSSIFLPPSFKALSLDKQHQHLLGTYLKCKFLNPIPDLRNVKEKVEAAATYIFTSPPSDPDAPSCLLNPALCNALLSHWPQSYAHICFLFLSPAQKLPMVQKINYILSLAIQRPWQSHFPNLLLINVFIVMNLIYLLSI